MKKHWSGYVIHIRSRVVTALNVRGPRFFNIEALSCCERSIEAVLKTILGE